jgi:hypothetical protein
MPESAPHQETEGMHPALANERRFINIAAYRFIAIRNGAQPLAPDCSSGRAQSNFAEAS